MRTLLNLRPNHALNIENVNNRWEVLRWNFRLRERTFDFQQATVGYRDPAAQRSVGSQPFATEILHNAIGLISSETNIISDFKHVFESMVIAFRTFVQAI